jgi:hypothetical protein
MRMVKISIKTIDKKVFPLSRDNFERHFLDPSELELSLDFGIQYNVRLEVKEHGNKVLYSSDKRTLAKKEYDRIRKAISNKHYRLKLYSNGKLDVEFYY